MLFLILVIRVIERHMMLGGLSFLVKKLRVLLLFIVMVFDLWL